HEFQVLTEVGEDRIAICMICDYRANLEKATRKIATQRSPDAIPAPTPVATPGTTSIEALEKALGLPASAFLKTLLLRTKDGVVAVVLPGDREANEPKLRKLLDVPSIQFAKDSDFAAVGGVPGFVGPVGLRNATFVAEDGTRRPFVGGSYGIGIGRSVQTIIETHHDERGIIWPPSVAPFHVHVIALPSSDPDVRAKSEALVAALERERVEVLYDDRDESAGVKFADADLIGIPLRVTVSKRNLKENALELKLRSASDSEMVPLAGAGERIAEIVRSWPR